MPQRHRTESSTSKRRLAAAERQVQALELRKAGVTFPMIATQLGYGSKQGAFLAVQAALKKTMQEPADEVRKLDLERLHRILLACWEKAIKGDLQAVSMVLRILERRAKLLGLDAPVQVTGPGGGPIPVVMIKVLYDDCLPGPSLPALVSGTEPAP